MDKNFGDDFEFKPLTEGLGFHKKTIDLRDDLPLQTTVLPKSKFKPALTAQPPQGETRLSSAKTSAPQSIHPLWTPALKNQTLTEVAKPMAPAPAAPVGPRFDSLAVSWPAAFFDGAMILGLGLLFSAVVFALTKIDLGELISMLRDEGGAQIAAVFLGLAVFEIYCVTCRSFFGKTLGEWAFDCRLGYPIEQKNMIYPLQVAWRTLIIALTGFICIPVLSSILGKDVAGILSGVSLKQEIR